MIDGVRLATKTGEGGAGVGEGVHANSEPRHAVAATHADEAEQQNDRESKQDGFALDRRQNTEIEDDDDGDEDPEQEEEFTLSDEIGFAGFDK